MKEGSKKWTRGRKDLVKRGAFGSQESHGGVFTDYPFKKIKTELPVKKRDKGISFWKIPGWREEASPPKNAVVM